MVCVCVRVRACVMSRHEKGQRLSRVMRCTSCRVLACLYSSRLCDTNLRLRTMQPVFMHVAEVSMASLSQDGPP